MNQKETVKTALQYIEVPKYEEPESVKAFHEGYQKAIRSLGRPTGLPMTAMEATVRYNEGMAHAAKRLQGLMVDTNYRAYLQKLSQYLAKALKKHLPKPPRARKIPPRGV